MKKIRTFHERFGYERSRIANKIHTDEMFAANFTKSPSRQGIHEKIAAEWLHDNLNLDIETLPKSGRNAVYVSNGIIGPIPATQTNRPSKSLDFRWKTNGITFYASHKYTKESGGVQDNQSREMENLLRGFLPATSESVVLLVIVDGEYYTPSKMQTLRGFTKQNPPKSFAAHIEEVPQIVETYRSGD